MLFGGESLVVEVEKVKMTVETACNEYFGGARLLYSRTWSFQLH
jgi:hypothetical protein